MTSLPMIGLRPSVIVNTSDSMRPDAMRGAMSSMSTNSKR